MAAPLAVGGEKQILAPASITRLSGQAREVRPDVWEVSMGDAVPAFVLANGPPKITNYNFLKMWGANVNTTLVSRRPVESGSSQSQQQKHDLADIYDVTPYGHSVAKAKPQKQARAPAAPTAAHQRSVSAELALPVMSLRRCSLSPSTAPAAVTGAWRLTRPTACAPAVAPGPAPPGAARSGSAVTAARCGS